MKQKHVNTLLPELDTIKKFQMNWTHKAALSIGMHASLSNDLYLHPHLPSFPI